MSRAELKALALKVGGPKMERAVSSAIEICDSGEEFYIENLKARLTMALAAHAPMDFLSRADLKPINIVCIISPEFRPFTERDLTSEIIELSNSQDSEILKDSEVDPFFIAEESIRGIVTLTNLPHEDIIITPEEMISNNSAILKQVAPKIISVPKHHLSNISKHTNKKHLRLKARSAL